ncbi:hypothetical protein ACK3YB_11400, partial [Aeromonas caviae]
SKQESGIKRRSSHFSCVNTVPVNTYECGDQTKVIEVTDRDSGCGHDDLPAKESNRSERPIAVKH